jgi:hypothetical protein
LSSAFAKISVNTAPYSNTTYTNINDDYTTNVPDKFIQTVRFHFRTGDHKVITLNGNFSFTLKLEILDDDEKQLVNQNTAIGELLHTLLLQQHVDQKSTSKNKLYIKTMSFFGNIKRGAESAVRFLASTGRSALKKIGDTSRTIRKVGSAINTVTVGAVGKAWEASKSLHGIGAVATNIEKGLDMADRASSAGLKATAIGERGAAAFKSGNMGGLKFAVGEAKGLYKSLR